MMFSTYDRIAEKLLKGQPKPRKIAQFIDGKVVHGHDTLHRTPQSRRWRLFWRIKWRKQTRLS